MKQFDRIALVIRPSQFLKFSVWLVFVGAGFYSAPLRAEEGAATVSITNTLSGGYNLDNGNGDSDDDNYGLIQNKFNLQGSSGGLLTWIRFDVTQFTRELNPDKYHNDYNLERFQVTHPLGHFKLTVGDFYKQVGRGIVLMLRKGDEVTPDGAIRGGELVWTEGNHQVEIFGGWLNQSNVDPVATKYFEEQDDILAGYQYAFRGGQNLKLGHHGLFYALENGLESTASAGLSLDAADITDWSSFYVESNLQSRQGSVEPMGYSAYGALDMFWGDSLVLLELIWLKNFQQQLNTDPLKSAVNRPPTLLRLQDELAVVRGDEVGGRIRFEEYFEDSELTLYVNGMYRIFHPGEALLKEDEYQVFLGAELPYQEGRSRLKLEVGYRDVFQDKCDLHFSQKAITHGYMDWVQYISDGYSLHILSDNEYWQKDELVGRCQSTRKKYLRGSTFVGVEKAGLGDISFELGYDKDPASAQSNSLFYAGIASWKISSDIILKTIGGTQRGGLKCVSGVCRNFPAFVGVKAELVVRY